VEARLFGVTTLALPVLLWPFLALPILLLVQFGADLFGANFMKIIFSLAFFFSKKKFFSVFLFHFFSKTVENFLFVFNKFLSTLHKFCNN